MQIESSSRRPASHAQLGHTDPEVIRIDDIQVSLADLPIYVVDDISFNIRPGEVIGLVGESGSGKTTAGLALLGYARSGLQIGKGSVKIGSSEILALEGDELLAARRSCVAYVPQDPGTALNPSLTIRTQLSEKLSTTAKVDDSVLTGFLSEVKLPPTSDFLNRFPHEMSGGQQQRVGIALAFASRPRLIVMDEPTTGLDVTTQAHVLQTIKTLCVEHKVAAVYVSHDLAVVANIADRVAVMYSGRVVELGETQDVLFRPQHPYTKALIRAVPRMNAGTVMHGISGQAPDPRSRPSGCAFSERCQYAELQCQQPQALVTREDHAVRCWKSDRLPTADVATSRVVGQLTQGQKVLSVNNVVAWYGNSKILHDISFDIREGECLALVGESGSGKTTLSRSISGLHSHWSGTIELDGKALAHAARNRDRESLRRMQYIFQNPYASLNPNRTIGDSVSMALRLLCGMGRTEARKRTLEVLDRVALPAAFADRMPRQLSGGQRQRAAIARAIAVNPSVLVCDEITSALDVSVQAVIVDLLAELQREAKMTLLFVTHNLPLVCNFAQRVLVMKGGQIVDRGTVETVLQNPSSEETRRLMADAPDFVSA